MATILTTLYIPVDCSFIRSKIDMRAHSCAWKRGHQLLSILAADMEGSCSDDIVKVVPVK